MIVLDTNVISEMLRAVPSPEVARWIVAQPEHELYITAVTEAEIRVGVNMMPTGKRKAQLQATIDQTIGQVFAGKILPFDSTAAATYADIWAKRRAAGKPISQFDAQIAAIARANGAEALVTRNVTDFANLNLTLINPWDAA
jgi:toxin FitB